MLSAGQLSLHVPQMRNVHTVPCSHVHLCHSLENPECTIKHCYTLQVLDIVLWKT